MLWHGCGHSCPAVCRKMLLLTASLTQGLLPVRLIVSPMMSSPRVGPSATVLLLRRWPLPAGPGVELLMGRWSLQVRPGPRGPLLMLRSPLLWLWMSLLLLLPCRRLLWLGMSLLLLLLLPCGRLLWRLSLPWGWLVLLALLLPGRCLLRVP